VNQATNPSTYLLTWNPSKHFTWEDLREEIEEVESGFHPGGSWSCGLTKGIVEGDRVFLMRLGDEPRGIVASGRVEGHDLFGDVTPVRPESDVYEAPYWEDQSDHEDNPEKTALYVNVSWDALLDPDRYIFTLSKLEELNEGFAEGEVALERASLDGAELEYQVSGTGELVVFIHGAFIADIFRPLLPSRSCPLRPRAEVPHNRRPGSGTPRQAGVAFPGGRTRRRGCPRCPVEWLSRGVLPTSLRSGIRGRNHSAPGRDRGCVACLLHIGHRPVSKASRP
jgi:hypothetical protein